MVPPPNQHKMTHQQKLSFSNKTKTKVRLQLKMTHPILGE